MKYYIVINWHEYMLKKNKTTLTSLRPSISLLNIKRILEFTPKYMYIPVIREAWC